MKSNTVKNILVIDLELNQPSERIIELGYVIGNPKSNEILTKKSILIDPDELLSSEIIALTGITQDMVKGRPNIQSAYETMIKEVQQYEAISIIHQWGGWVIPLCLKNNSVIKLSGYLAVVLSM